jgi:hypothetical protein
MSEQHLGETQQTEPLGIKIKIVVLIAVMFVILLAVIVFGAQAGVRYAYQQEQEERWLLPNRELQQLEREQIENINRYGVVNAQRGLYSVPIERAMEAVAERQP